MFKIDWNKKYTTIAAYVVIVVFICAFGAVLIANIISNGAIPSFITKTLEILSPLTYGFAIAYLINPLVKLLERYVFKFVSKKKPRVRLRRALSIALAYFLMLLLLAGFVFLMIPQITSSYNELSSKIPTYIEKVYSWADDIVTKLPSIGKNFTGFDDFLEKTNISSSLKDTITGSGAFLQTIGNWVMGFAETFVTEMKNAFFGMIISIYLLFSKELLIAQTKKVLSAVFKPKHVKKIISATRYANYTFGGFITGKIVESIIVGIISFIVLGIFDIPFFPLASVIIAVTNIVPIFGPFLGAIISGLFILIANPIKVLWFAIIILVIQQIDGNIIGPKIVGNRTGLSSLWVIISLIIGGGLFGFVGMILSVPIFAMIYTLIRHLAANRLAKKKLPTDTLDYYGDGYPDKVREAAEESGVVFEEEITPAGEEEIPDEFELWHKGNIKPSPASKLFKKLFKSRKKNKQQDTDKNE
ncbi:MAG: AI-2E family transporter [Clostridia bacterium]|nr:AI-2E family transporter [Clostridia bacterium]